MEKTLILNRLRAVLERHDLAALIIPSNDPHQSEYVADHWLARSWVSGFTGSAGTAVVTRTEAGLWTDSRYFIQAQLELEGGPLTFHKQAGTGTPDYLDWLGTHLQPGDKVAIDGALLSLDGEDSLRSTLASKGLQLVTEHDPVGEVWTDRPSLPTTEIFAHPVSLAGLDRKAKLAQVRAMMAKAGATSHLMVALDDIAWALNLRGRDVESNPVFYAYVLIDGPQTTLFIQAGKVNATLAAELEADGLNIRPYAELGAALASVRGPLLLDRAQASFSLLKHIAADCKIVSAASPAMLLKAIKSKEELAHIREAMAQDGVALLRLCRWLEAQMQAGTYPTEYEVGQQLAAQRAARPGYFGESFAAIAGYAGNGAIVHYRPTATGSATLKPEGVFLLDSGGQYENGTTDITRTFALGPWPERASLAYTMVLKGHISLARAQFPVGTAGYHLDPLARQHLWAHGMNYGHGTGHGVGYFLNVHEGPQGIGSVAAGRSKVPLQPGMLISNEPGYYETDSFGIRIENLVVCTEAPAGPSGTFYQFETLSLFPIEATMIDWDYINFDEQEWLSDYHHMVLHRLSPLLEADEQAWLKEKCAPYLFRD